MANMEKTLKKTLKRILQLPRYYNHETNMTIVDSKAIDRVIKEEGVSKKELINT